MLAVLKTILFLQIKFSAERRGLRQNLDRLVQQARDRALAKTRFRQLQQRVLAVFASNRCQSLIALMIFAVHQAAPATARRPALPTSRAGSRPPATIRPAPLPLSRPPALPFLAPLLPRPLAPCPASLTR